MVQEKGCRECSHLGPACVGLPSGHCAAWHKRKTRGVGKLKSEPFTSAKNYAGMTLGDAIVQTAGKPKGHSCATCKRYVDWDDVGVLSCNLGITRTKPKCTYHESSEAFKDGEVKVDAQGGDGEPEHLEGHHVATHEEPVLSWKSQRPVKGKDVSEYEYDNVLAMARDTYLQRSGEYNKNALDIFDYLPDEAAFNQLLYMKVLRERAQLGKSFKGRDKDSLLDIINYAIYKYVWLEKAEKEEVCQQIN